MSSEWRQVTLKEVTSVLGDGLHGTPEYDPNGDHFFINGNNLSSGKIVFTDATKRVSATEAAKYKKEQYWFR
jgi:type I restriction enzyme S subunit